MSVRSPASCGALLLTLLVACQAEVPMQPDGALDVGESLSVTGARQVRLDPGMTRGEYVAVVVNTGAAADVAATYALDAVGLAAPSLAVAPVEAAALDRLAPAPAAAPTALRPDVAFEGRLRDRERVDLTPRLDAARRWFATREPPAGMTEPRRASLPTTVHVGDTVQVNVNLAETCANPTYHRARVAALGVHAVVLTDVGNPRFGFSDADFQRYAARFDTVVYPLDVAVFGAPTDIDRNGRVALVFTSEVNRQTPSGSGYFVGGMTYSRDLFPVKGTGRAQACAASNEGEYFYLLAPDPFGTINGNRRSAGFVDTSTTAVIAHEFQHLINMSRRLYVSNAPRFEEKWLDEGLAHVAEELLFYHDAGVAPRGNLGAAALRGDGRLATAFDLDMLGGGNVGRYRTYLADPSHSSPYATGDALSTRGAAWSLLRYLADRAADADGTIFFRLANGPAVGMANLQAVFGQDVAAKIRDWSVSHAVDDHAVTAPELQQRSWNWHGLFDMLYSYYPLHPQPMADATTYSGAVVAGGSAFHTLSVPAGGSATVTLRGQGGTMENVQLVIVRTR